MELSAQALEQIVNPVELINLLGEELHTGLNGEYTTVCPKCERKLFIIDKEFVCENNLCTFRAGSSIDYLVAKGISTWDNVVETLNRILHGSLKNSIIYTNQKIVAQQLKSKRRIFDFFLRHSVQDSNTNIRLIQFRSALRTQGLDPDALKNSVFVLDEKSATTLKEAIKALNPEKIIQLQGPVIVLPYFSNYHSISHLIILKTPAAKPEKISITPSRISYFSLLQRHPACKNTHLASSYAESAKINTQYSRTNPENVCLHAMVDAAATGASFILSKSSYIPCGDSSVDLRIVGTLQRYVSSLFVISNRVYAKLDYSPVEADEFVLECVVKELKKNVPISSILPLMELTPRSRQSLLEQLHKHRYFSEADTVRSFFKTLPIYQDDKITLYSSPQGYTVKKHSNDSYTNCVSNFTVELENNIVFTESTDIFHTGHILFNSDKFPIVLKQEEIDKINDLEKAARRASVGALDQINIPTIKERSAGKYITNYLRDQVSQLPKTEGIPMLGWSPRRSSFYAPYFIADRKTTRTGKKYLHPSVSTLSNFSTDLEGVSSLHHDLPEPIVDIMNQAAAFITRSFLSMQIRPLMIYNNAEARRLLSEMFLSLGQTTLVQLNHNMRGEEMPGLRGFPFYAVGYSSSQINKSSLSAFILCDTGLTINENFSSDIIHKAQRTLKYIVQTVSEWALRTNAESFQQANSVSRPNAYSMEGARVIIDACGLTSWPSSKTPFQTIDSILRNISVEEVKNFFIRDINNHSLQIKKEAYAQVSDLTALEAELRSLAKHVTISPEAIDVDSDSMLEALSSFYHVTPTVTEKFDGDRLMDSFKLT